MNLRAASVKVIIVFSGLALGVAYAGIADAKPSPNGQSHSQARRALAVEGRFGFLSLGPPESVIQASPALCLIELPATFSFAGDLEGSFASVFHIQHFGPCDQPAAESFETQGVFVGSVLGGAGTFSFDFAGAIDAQSNALGDLTILEGTDELEGLEGVITLAGVTGVGGSYSGEVEFD